MIKVGKLAKYKTDDTVLVEIVSTYNKADIDPNCPESVAIIGMVKVMYIRLRTRKASSTFYKKFLSLLGGHQ